MGCTMSSIDKEERVRMCKERKKLMKQLLCLRADFANSIVAYLKALKNTGVTLQQFTESESSELENIPFMSGMLTSLQPPLPPSLPPPLPPPPPPDSPDLRQLRGSQNANEAQEKMIDIGDDICCVPPSPCIPSSSSEGFHLLESSSVLHESESAILEEIDDENWAETKSQFEEEDREHVSNKSSHALETNLLSTDTTNDDLSTIRRQVKEDMAMVVWRSKKTLLSVVNELDDYFLKASAGGKEIAVLVDVHTRNTYLHHDSKERKGNNSARILSSLSWSWSSRSMHLTRDTVDSGSPFEPCKSGAHCITLEKLYDEEEILYKAVKEEEMAKLEHERKSSALKRQQNENADLNKIEKTQSAVESLQSDIVRLQELVRSTCSCVLALINEELHPQLVALLSGLIHMWKTMYESHKAQSRICQQVKHISDHCSTKPTTEDHHDATVQLENEVNFWYNSFCRLIKCQRQYVSVLCKWIQLTDCLVDGENQNHCPSTVRTLCQRWQLALDRLPEQVVSEAMKSFLLVIRSILKQQEEEGNLKKKSDKLERRLHKELNSLIEINRKLEESGISGDTATNLSPKHPLSMKRAKAAALGKQYEEEKAKYLNSIQVSRAMTLNNLHSCLPSVFQALMGFSSACAQALEIALSRVEQAADVEQSYAES